MSIKTFIALIVIQILSASMLYSADGSNVIVVYNTKSSFGKPVADHYQKARQVPSSNIFSLSCDTSEVITRSIFNKTILKPLRDSIDKFPDVKNKALYLVLTKGIPLKIISDGGDGCSDDDTKDKFRTSVDARLCYLFDFTFRDSINDQDFPARKNTYTHLWSVPSYKNFRSFGFFSYMIKDDPDTISYLVCRLDAYNVRDIFGMIDRSVSALNNAKGRIFVLDDDPKPFPILDEGYRVPNDFMAQTRDSLLKLGWKVKYDNTADAISIEDMTIGYCSYGFNSSDYKLKYNGDESVPFLNGYGPDQSDIKFADGALFCSYESWNAWSFYRDNINGSKCSGHNNLGHNLIADFIRAGGTGGVGYVYEPYSWGLFNEAILFSAYVSGYNFAESAYLSLRYFNWRTVVTGDPLSLISN